MNHSEDKDPAWDLLNRAQKTQPSGEFVPNVMREIGDQDGSGLGFHWRLVAAAAVAIGLAVSAFVLFPEQVSEVVVNAPESPQSEQITIEQFTDELDELAYMDSLMSVPDISLLADQELADLLF